MEPLPGARCFTRKPRGCCGVPGPVTTEISAAPKAFSDELLTKSSSPSEGKAPPLAGPLQGDGDEGEDGAGTGWPAPVLALRVHVRKGLAPDTRANAFPWTHLLSRRRTPPPSDHPGR